MKDFYSPELSPYYDIVLYGKKTHVAGENEMEFMNYAFREYPPAVISNILDIGCGTGRFTVPLAKAGYTLTGMDKSGGMLDVCVKKLKEAGTNADLIKLSLSEFGPVSMFEGAICMDSVLCYGGSSESISTGLAKIHACLCRDGVAVIETWNLRSNMHLLNREHEFINEDGGIKAKVREKNTYDAYRNILTITICAEINDNGKIFTGTHEEKLMIPDFEVMKHMMEKAGFAGIEIYSDFDGTPASEPGASMLYIGRKG